MKILNDLDVKKTHDHDNIVMSNIYKLSACNNLQILLKSQKTQEGLKKKQTLLPIHKKVESLL